MKVVSASPDQRCSLSTRGIVRTQLLTQSTVCSFYTQKKNTHLIPLLLRLSWYSSSYGSRMSTWQTSTSQHGMRTTNHVHCYSMSECLSTAFITAANMCSLPHMSIHWSVLFSGHHWLPIDKSRKWLSLIWNRDINAKSSLFLHSECVDCHWIGCGENEARDAVKELEEGFVFSCMSERHCLPWQLSTGILTGSLQTNYYCNEI